jgi:hypothetical protein
MEMGMPVQLAAPGVQNAEKRSLHLPVVLLESPQSFRRRSEQDLARPTVVEFEELVPLRRHCEDDMEVRTVCKTLTNSLGPRGLPRSETAGAMAVTARTGIPFTTMTPGTFRPVEAQLTMPTMSDEIERGILRFAQSPRPLGTKIPQKIIDTRTSHGCSCKHHFENRQAPF